MAKILVVDDSETQRFQIKKALQTAGYEVIEAVDGQEGLQKLEGDAGIGLILCDVNMPVMDGLTMCTKLNEKGSHAGVPIFMLTTESSNELKEAGKKVGVRAWIIKPYVAEKLLAAIEKVIKK